MAVVVSCVGAPLFREISFALEACAGVTLRSTLRLVHYGVEHRKPLPRKRRYTAPPPPPSPSALPKTKTCVNIPSHEPRIVEPGPPTVPSCPRQSAAARRAAADAPRSPQAKSAESRFSSGPSGKDKTWAVYKEVEAPVLVVNRSGHMGPGASTYRGKPEKSQCTNQELKGGVRIHRVRIRVVVVGTHQTVRELTSVRRRQEGADAVNL